MRPFQHLLLPLALAGLAAVSAFGQDPIEVSNTREIFISAVGESPLYGKSQKGDEALLITEKSEIARWVALFDKNLQHKVHACGYHWRVIFYRNGAQPTEIFFNEDCEVFDRDTDAICEVVQAKFRQTVERPNAYLTSLEIDVNKPPEEARADLTSRGNLKVLELRPLNRLPYVEIRASSTSRIPENRTLWDAEKARLIQDADRKLINDIARIRERYAVYEISNIRHGMSIFGGGEIREQRRAEVYFAVGSDLAGVGKLLNESKIEKSLSPIVYSLQILTGSRLTRSEGDKLKLNFPFIRALSQY